MQKNKLTFILAFVAVICSWDSSTFTIKCSLGKSNHKPIKETFCKELRMNKKWSQYQCKT